MRDGALVYSTYVKTNAAGRQGQRKQNEDAEWAAIMASGRPKRSRKQAERFVPGAYTYTCTNT